MQETQQIFGDHCLMKASQNCKHLLRALYVVLDQLTDVNKPSHL